MLYFLASCLILPTVFGLIIWIEPRTIWSGIVLGLLLIELAIVALMGMIRVGDSAQSNDLLRLLFLVFGLGTLFAFLAFPFIVLLFLFYHGVLLIKREGFKLTNCLTLGLVGGIIFYLLVWPFTRELFKHRFFDYLYGYLSLLVVYFALIASAYLLAAIINLIHVRKKHYDYYVVLGAGLINDQVTPLLAGRISKAIALHRRDPGSKILMSGGRGEDEGIAEGTAMAEWALNQGVPSDVLLVEDKSRNTEENLRFSAQLMDDPAKRFAIVTTNYHVFRGLLHARKQKLSCVGYGSKTKIYFLINAFIREFIGYIVLTKNTHYFLIGGYSLLFLAGVIISEMPF